MSPSATAPSTATDEFIWSVSPPANVAPVVDSVTITPATPANDQLLTAAVTSHDANSDPLTTSYQWTISGVDIAGATSSTLNLATAGNGDRGDLIRVRVMVNDGFANSDPVTADPVTVANSAPVFSTTSRTAVTSRAPPPTSTPTRATPTPATR